MGAFSTGLMLMGIALIYGAARKELFLSMNWQFGKGSCIALVDGWIDFTDGFHVI